MHENFISPVMNLVAKGAAHAVPEIESQLIAHMKRTYLPYMSKYRREQQKLADAIRSITLY
jgi:hypothetical protein